MTPASEIHGEVITFYSYKGGSGRSMALANVACLLADQEQLSTRGRVLVVDWDLEAPGLHRFFQPYLSRTEAEVENQPGLMDLFVELVARTAHLPASPEPPSDLSWLGDLDFRNYTMTSTIPGLDVMKAGRSGQQYVRAITTFDWAGLYERAPWLFGWFTNELTHRYRYALIDSRTGETDTSSICTSIMPEKLVAVFTPNLQGIHGVIRQIERAVRFRRSAADERPIKILPVPSRIENARPALRDLWRFESPIGFQPRFEQLFRDLFGLKSCDLTAYFAKMQIPQSPDYAFGEPIAVLQENTRDRFSLSGSYVDLEAYLLDDADLWEQSSESAVQIAQRAFSSSVNRQVSAEAAPPEAAWPDLAQRVRQLERSLTIRDWGAAASQCDSLTERILHTGNLLPVREVEQILSMLRLASRFELARRLAEALIQTGETSNRVHLSYARALLESRAIAAAIPLLERIVETERSDVEGVADAYGLLGSAYASVYVNLSGAPAERRRSALTRSVENYAKARSLSSARWELFAIDSAALLLRAERDGVEASGLGDPRLLAKTILESISDPSRKLSWEFGVGIQAALAIGDHAEAARWLELFLGFEAASNSDNLGSILDKLTGIWGLIHSAPPGNVLLARLRARIAARAQTGTAPRTFRIFISYASEDLPIATAIGTCLRDALPGLFTEINLDREFLDPGTAFKKQIEATLQNTDVFIILYGGPATRSRGFTGWEVGYFDHVMWLEPSGRRKVPFYLYDPPATSSDEQGIRLGLEREQLEMTVDQFESQLVVRPDEPICMLLQNWQEEVDGLVKAAGFPPPKRRPEQYPVACVRTLKLAIFRYLKGTIESILLPQKQLTIRVKGSALAQAIDNLPPDAEIRPHGPGSPMAIFGLQDEPLRWERFLALTAGNRFCDSWRDAIASVVMSSFPGRLDIESSQIITSADEVKSYRVIVTRATKYFDDNREIDVCFVEELSRRDYGDSDTQDLLKGLESVLRIRSLFLEPTSDFSGRNILLDRIDLLPELAKRLLRELNSLRRDSQSAGLDEPRRWRTILSWESLRLMSDVYRPAESKMREIIARIGASKATGPGLEPLRQELAVVLEEVEHAIRPVVASLAREMTLKLQGTVES